MSRSHRAGLAIARAQAAHAPTQRQIAFLKSLCDELGIEYIRPLSRSDAGTDIEQLQAVKAARSS